MEGELLIAFDSTQQALRAEMLLEYAEIEIDIFPTPKEITAGCAMSIAFGRSELGPVCTIIKEQTIEIRGIYGRAGEDGGYALIVEQEELK
ncbi:DUF3343 domain-containing protein [Paenibacillus tepidiphilus]|uniref:DUF3343 domain-containing protein n=1 Tax=Paenibacillus tepidiphilus TaxID=2608683 RepID=UPI00123A3EC2|nr:DUF3343 domain-containing protein [Paenibacillus tepidiphilus]